MESLEALSVSFDAPCVEGLSFECLGAIISAASVTMLSVAKV